ncbi:unnamed protein product [Lactuca virosa]|uniref:Uncharacterized protein n=1 Tax=Lactuca virosa TaxID=75947 RepID=A0AAU9PLE9_9ASTR|nr:unnamed protein product [Lactuca virosa]
MHRQEWFYVSKDLWTWLGPIGLDCSSSLHVKIRQRRHLVRTRWRRKMQQGGDKSPPEASIYLKLSTIQKKLLEILLQRKAFKDCFLQVV